MSLALKTRGVSEHWFSLFCESKLKLDTYTGTHFPKSMQNEITLLTAMTDYERGIFNMSLLISSGLACLRFS